MIKGVLVTVALALSIGACARESVPTVANAPSQTPPPTAAIQQFNFTTVDRLLERRCPQLGGCALVLVRDGDVIYRKSFGRYTPERVVPVASASKWLSGAVIMALIDEGKIRLDDSVSRYLPEFTGDKADITIRQLFSHTSGLPPEAPCRNNRRTSLTACAREMAQLRLRAAPGQEFHYGGVSMHVGGRIAEIVSGNSWNELFVNKIARPLGMARTDFFAYGPTANPRPAGDARSSADDYAKFLMMLLNDGSMGHTRVLSAQSVAELHKDQTGGARIAYTIYEKHLRLDPSLPLARYGVGVWRERVDGTSGELLDASSQGALGFCPWIDFERSLGGVLSTQSSFSRVTPVYLELKKELRQILH